MDQRIDQRTRMVLAVATALKAQEQGIARVSRSSEALYTEARRSMSQAREAMGIMMHAGLIQPVPET